MRLPTKVGLTSSSSKMVVVGAAVVLDGPNCSITGTGAEPTRRHKIEETAIKNISNVRCGFLRMTSKVFKDLANFVN